MSRSPRNHLAMRGTVLIVLGALLVTAQVAVAQELGPKPVPPEARQVGEDTVTQASSRVDPGVVPQRAQARADSRTGLQGRIGGLPLTGIDLIVISGAALLMTGIGFWLQRASAPRLPPGT